MDANQSLSKALRDSHLNASKDDLANWLIESCGLAFMSKMAVNQELKMINDRVLVTFQELSLVNDSVSLCVDYTIAYDIQEAEINLNWETDAEILELLYHCQSLESLTLKGSSFLPSPAARTPYLLFSQS
ncbi:uncharacterized protein A4U43_C08F28790 [Asparagus officinalis]|nr:uncharacterized protein A4U43_C08F28790 [Asparagus officinalis]